MGLGGLHTALRTDPISHPVIYTPFEPLKKHPARKRLIGDTDIKQGCHLLSTDTWHRFLPRHSTRTGANVGQMLRYQWRIHEVWCVPSAIHMPYVHRSQNKPLSKSDWWLIFIFLKCIVSRISSCFADDGSAWAANTAGIHWGSKTDYQFSRPSK